MKAMTKTLAMLAAACALVSGCKKSTGRAVVRQIASRTDLIGGPGALGEVGDYLLANDKIRVIIQSGTFSRGFGVYAGSLIDADLVRAQTGETSKGGNGFDNFGEMFPGMFLKAIEPASFDIRQEEDGSAVVTVLGAPNEFLFLIQRINSVLIPDDCGGRDCLRFINEYRLRPGKQYVEITSRVINNTASDLSLPGEGVSSLTGGAEFPLPLGDVVLFGAGNKIFSEGAGFDMRFTLERLYEDPPPLPALPGLVTPFIASKSEHVSYGFMSAVDDPALSLTQRSKIPGASTSDLLIPFVFSAFTGAFYGAAPDVLEAGREFSFKKYFIVGRGDIASIRDVVHEIRETEVGVFSGRVFEALNRVPEAGVEVITYDADGSPYNQHTTDDHGQFRGTYAPGKYTYLVTADGRFPSEPVAFEIKQGQTTTREIGLESPGTISVAVRAEDGRPMPAKCSLIGVHPRPGKGALPRDFLYSFQLGERRRPTDLIPDTADPKTREFIEEVVHTAGRASKSQSVRPGKYRVVCSRGIEYELAEQEVDIKPGAVAQVSVTLKRAFDTTGWVSGDYHLHQINSLDSSLPLEERVIECASEGIDIALSSDHNYVTDLTPAIAANGLQQWLQGMVGIELTTLEVGHFNSFPLRYDPGPITKGSFAWSGRTPTEVFGDLRKLGAYGPENTIIQVNHPRDTILGYFNDYNFNPDTGLPEPETGLFLVAEGPEFGPENFDLDFDALEVFNGKRFELLRSFRVPETLPERLPEGEIPAAGELLRDANGKVAFPGAMEDWFVMLNKGQRYAGLGNSDTHDSEEEPGSPRTYTPASNDRPGEIDELEVVRAIKAQQAIVTNGPFPLIQVCPGDGAANGCRGMGQTVNGTSGKVTVKLEIRSASWVEFGEVNFIVNGDIVATKTGDRTSLASIEQTLDITRDSWVLVEINGTKSQWPVYTPLEIPSLQVTDAVGGIAESFGIELNPFGDLQPGRQFVTRSYAFTNPVYIDADGDGAFEAPGVRAQALTAARDAPRVSVQKPNLRELPAVMRMFGAFGAH